MPSESCNAIECKTIVCNENEQLIVTPAKTGVCCPTQLCSIKKLLCDQQKTLKCTEGQVQRKTLPSNCTECGMC